MYDLFNGTHIYLLVCSLINFLHVLVEWGLKSSYAISILGYEVGPVLKALHYFLPRKWYNMENKSSNGISHKNSLRIAHGIGLDMDLQMTNVRSKV